MAVAATVGMATVGILPTGASAQSSGSTPGVTDKAVTLGFISSETGVASPTFKQSHDACKARIEAENAKGGVNGRKIDLITVDDKSSQNLQVAQDLVQNRNAFAVVDNSSFAFTAYRYLKSQGVPMIGGGFDGAYYYDEGNENIISGLGNGSPPPGLAYDIVPKVMKRLGAKKIAAVGYGISPASSESAKAIETYGADAVGLKGVYLNTTIDFGSTDVSPIVLGIKNSGADALYMPLDDNTNVALVQGLQQNNVPMKANVLATGYGQELLDQPASRSFTPQDVIQLGYRPVELGGPAIKKFQSNLKKYGGITGVPNAGVYYGYIACDIAVMGLKNAGKDLTRQGFIDAIRNTNGGKYNPGGGLTCQPLSLGYDTYGKVDSTSCLWFVNVKDGKFHVLNKGKPFTGKIVGDPDLLEQYTSSAGTGVTTTVAPAS